MSSIILRSLLVTICSLCIERTLSTNVQRIWTYQSTIRVDSMGMEGNSFAMHGRGLTTIVQGSDLIYQDATAVPKPSTVWVGSCVYETDENFVRCVNRKSPIYNANSNLPVCTTDADPTILVADPYCDGPGPPASYKFHSQNYDPPAPASVANNVGDEYGAHVSLAGDLETGALLAVGAPSTYDSATSTFYETHGAVYMHSGEYKRWTENQKLVADDSNQFLTANRPNFGKIVEIDRVTSRTTLVSCPQCVSSSTTEGSVYVYKSENGKSWSKTQQLTADDATTSDYAFGLNVKVHDDFAMIAADGLSPQRGALYMFREERHSVYKNGVYNGQWTQQQKLVPHDAYIRGQGTQWGGSADMHGKTLVVGMKEEPSHGTMTGAAYVYKSSKTMEIPHHQAIRAADIDMKPKPIPMHKWWTQVQKLYPADPHTYRMFGNEVAIWGDVIAVMGIGESLSDSDWSTPGTYYQFGSVYMFARDGFSSDSWTQQQKLYNPDANDGTIFSQSVDDSYQANTIGAGDLDYNRFGIPRLHGSSLAVSSYGDTWYSAFTYFMTDNVDWKCLLITVGDGMGDGWGDSRLVATSPSGPSNEVKHDTFSQFCDSYNYDKVNEKIPLSRKFQETYRYCPLSSQDEGDYIFEIMGNPRGTKGDKGKPTDDLYWREIYWEVKNELNNELFRGDARTKMTFNWGKKDFFFTDVKIEREFIPPDVCSQCNVWEGLKNDRRHQPKQKPAPKMVKTDADVSRRLNLYPTPSPTTSLSPTMTWDTASVTDQWMFYMGRQTSPAYGSTTTWFDKNKNGTGTHFYIYDSNGQNITEPLIWGQLCELTGTIADSCDTQVLTVGGTYTLRVTGGMDYRRNEIQWKFCNIAGTAQQTLVFNVYSSTCLPIALYDSEEMCEKNGFQVTTSATAVLKGLVGLYSEQRDSSIVKKAFKTMFEPFVASSIRIVVEEENLYAASTLDDITLRVEATFDSNANKVNVESLDGLHNFESALVQKLSYLDDNNLISSIMISSAMDVLVGDTHNVMSGNSIECHITNVQLVSAVPKTLENIARERVHNSEFAEDVDVEAAVNVQNVKWDHTTEVEYNILNAEAIGGYVIVGCAVIAGVVVVLVSWHQSYKRRTHYQGTADDEDDRLTVSLSGV